MQPAHTGATLGNCTFRSQPGSVPNGTFDLWDDLRRLREEHHLSLIATVLNDRAEALEHATIENRQILLFGNEADGLTDTEIAASDRCITIPMHGHTDSLNVGNAAAIFLYHFIRPCDPP